MAKHNYFTLANGKTSQSISHWLKAITQLFSIGRWQKNYFPLANGKYKNDFPLSRTHVVQLLIFEAQRLPFGSPSEAPFPWPGPRAGSPPVSRVTAVPG